MYVKSDNDTVCMELRDRWSWYKARYFSRIFYISFSFCINIDSTQSDNEKDQDSSWVLRN